MTGCLVTDWYGIKFHTEYEYSDRLCVLDEQLCQKSTVYFENVLPGV